MAKVGQRIPAAEPLAGSSWRRQLKHLAGAMLLAIAVLLVSALTVALLARPASVRCAAAHDATDCNPHIPRMTA